MDDDFTKLFEEAILLELHVSKLYLLFSKLFPEDAGFWWQICLEEKNHAALLKSGQETFLPSELFPDELLYPHLQELVEANKTLTQLLEDYKKTPPCRIEAFECALRLESMAAEQHFQSFMDLRTPDSTITEMFQMLNNGDKDHILRIQNFMKQHGLQ